MLSIVLNILDYLNVSEYTKAIVMTRAIELLIGRRCIEETEVRSNNH